MAGSASIDDVIGIVPLTEALRTQTSGIPNPFPAEFATVKPSNRILGDRARYIRIKGARTTAKIAAYGAPGRRVPLQPLEPQTVRMLFLSMEFLLDANMLNRLQAFLQGGAYQQDEGMDFLQYQIEEVGKRMANTRIVCMASMLRYGAIYWDSDGNVLPSSSGASTTYSAQVAATHQSQLNGIISQSWALTNTDIMAQLRVLNQSSVQATGLQMQHAMIGLNIPTYFQTNVTLQPYLARHQNFRDTLVDTNMVPANFADIKSWVNVSHAFFEDASGTNQLLWDNDLIVFTPDMSPGNKMDWWAMYEGSAAVLSGVDAYSDPMAALAACKQEYGQSGYSMPTFQSPLGVNVFMQDVFFPGIKNENAIYQADVAF